MKNIDLFGIQSNGHHVTQIGAYHALRSGITTSDWKLGKWKRVNLALLTPIAERFEAACKEAAPEALATLERDFLADESEIVPATITEAEIDEIAERDSSLKFSDLAAMRLQELGFIK